ncbi:MAG: ATP-binding protein [Candidatus Sumerlaeota bacterium]|nr:ATP-binding protein [Candidatus Sumerlaeota bacterium]
MRAERFNWLIYTANVLFMVFALSILIWLKNQFVKDVERTMKETSALFTRSILGDPDNRHVRFEEWEERARGASHSQFIEDLVLSKVAQEDGKTREIVVYPFTYAARHGTASPSEDRSLRRVMLSDSEGPYGALYFALNLSSVQSVRIAIWTLAALLALALLALSTRLWTQERALTQTTVELEEKRRQLIRLERLALAGQLTANIFHDIRKPVLNIRHELESLGETLGNFAGASKGLRNIGDQVDLFFTMLRDLSLERFVRAQDEAEFVELPKTVEQACRLVQYERGAVKLTLESPPALPLVHAPPYRLIQVFSNLALNAYEAMSGKGELRIVMRQRGDRIEVVVADSGPGIPLELQSKIFAPFFSTKAEGDGAGLGLYISRQIVEELGGDIRLDSKDGLGAAFTVSLPIAAPRK